MAAVTKPKTDAELLGEALAWRPGITLEQLRNVVATLKSGDISVRYIKAEEFYEIPMKTDSRRSSRVRARE